MPFSTTKSRARFAAGIGLCAALLLGGCDDLFGGGDDEDGRQNWAVVVGVSKYRTGALNLKWAEEDALDFAAMLREGNGWEADKVTLLTNASATREAIKGALARLSERVGSDDQVVFYFAGRGSYGPDQPPFDEGDGLDEYLVPHDGLTDSTAQDLSDDTLESLLSALPTNDVLVVLDTGFSGAAFRRGFAPEKGRVVFRAGGGRDVAPNRVDGMGHELARPGYVFISSAQPGFAPGESGQLRNGVFTHFLVEALRGTAGTGKKAVSVQEAFESAAPRTAALEPGQTPQIADKSGKRLFLALR